MFTRTLNTCTVLNPEVFYYPYIVGFLLDKKIGVNQPKRIENAKILIANTGMDTDKIKVCLHFLKLVASCYKLRMGIHCTIKVRLYMNICMYTFLVCLHKNVCMFYGTLRSNESDAIFLLSS